MNTYRVYVYDSLDNVKRIMRRKANTAAQAITDTREEYPAGDTDAIEAVNIDDYSDHLVLEKEAAVSVM